MHSHFKNIAIEFKMNIIWRNLKFEGYSICFIYQINVFIA